MIENNDCMTKAECSVSAAAARSARNGYSRRLSDTTPLGKVIADGKHQDGSDDGRSEDASAPRASNARRLERSVHFWWSMPTDGEARLGSSSLSSFPPGAECKHAKAKAANDVTIEVLYSKILLMACWLKALASFNDACSKKL